MKGKHVYHPPRVARWLLARFLSFEERMDVLGDLEEEFGERIRERGYRHATTWYRMEVLLALPAFISRSIYWSIIMLANYLKIAFRTLLKHRVFSLINIACLAIGIAACLFILQYAGFEFSYDSFHTNKDDLYRLTDDRFQNGALIQHGVITYPSVPKAMKEDYPEVLEYTRGIQWGRRMYVRHGDVGFNETNRIYADSAFFCIFTFPFLEGDPTTALAAPFSLVLSRSSADKYFGSGWTAEEVLGAVLQVDNAFDYTVTGVFDDVPAHSHMSFDFVMSWASLGQIYGTFMDDSWTNSNFMAYLLLAPGTDPANLEEKFVDFSRRYFDGNRVTGSEEAFFLQPLADIHLYSDYEYETWVHGNGTAVWSLVLIAVFILVIAWVNYINLATSRSIERAKEVGMRKVIGARRFQLIRQFLLESILLNMLGFVIALLLVRGLLPSIMTFLGIEVALPLQQNNLALLFLLVFLAGMVISGLYPAMLFSSFRILSVLKGKFSSVGRGRLIRKGLVVFQFVASFVLIAGTFVVYAQISFMKNKDLGMNIDQMLAVRGPRLSAFDSTFYNNISGFKDAVLTQSSVTHAATSTRLPGNRTGRIFDVQVPNSDSDQRYTTSEINVDYQYFDAFDMEMLAGRGFDASDHNLDGGQIDAAIINKTAAELLGYDDFTEAVNEPLTFWGRSWEIIGIVEDHHQQSPHVPVEPIIFTPFYSTGGLFFFKLRPLDLPATIRTVGETYAEYFPGNSFDYFFLDDLFNGQYQNDQLSGRIFGLFAFLGILLAGLGLFGLSLYTTAQRTKEIGVRKALGASSTNILNLLLNDFLRLVGIAILTAVPLTYIAANQWLARYAYHIDIGWSLFVLPGLMLVLIAVVTVSFQTIKAATANPVSSLRYE